MAKTSEKNNSEEPIKMMCGVVMPISEIDGCSEGHWQEVYSILKQSIDNAGFIPNMVSNADDVGVIQKRIIQNLYENPIVVCDVSGKNSNVMFELGMRLAFDKPTIIIKDDKTNYSFDTSPIEHLEYPRDLRFSRIVDFKEKLTEKITQTYKKSSQDSEFSTFLKHFGSFKVAKIETEVVSKDEFIIEELRSLRELVMRNNRFNRYYEPERNRRAHLFEETEDNHITMCFGEMEPIKLEPILRKIINIKGILNAEIESLSPEHLHLELRTNGMPKKILIERLEKITSDNPPNYIR